ncbi:hypothetical protein Tco_0800211 [Tanacetum coccineum]|uniref:Reverse transcriptase domain-containing protein n=1 Tax=Tanacetum coccineum TaxID=301880 RepID=A0ABQ4ZWN9_9ASTR
MEEDSKVPLILGRPFLYTADAVIRVKQKQLNLGVETERMIFNIDSAIKHSYSNDDTCFSIDVIDEILEEDFNALLDEGSEILYSIEGTILEEKLFAEFDEFMAMTADEDSKSESDTEEPPFEKITFNTDYKIKTSLEEPPTDLELKPLPDNLEYVFLEEPSFLPVIISSQLSEENKNKLVFVAVFGFLDRRKEATVGLSQVCNKKIIKRVMIHRLGHGFVCDEADLFMVNMGLMNVNVSGVNPVVYGKYKEYDLRLLYWDLFDDKRSGRPSGSLPSNTQPNPKGISTKPYQPPQARNEHVNAISTRIGKSYDPPVNPNDQQNDSETPINFDSDDEDDEPTPQPKPKNLKPLKETPTPKPYKPKLKICSLKLVNLPFLPISLFSKWKKTVKFPLSWEDLFFTLPMHIDVIDEILEEDFDALLDEGMTADEKSESESDTEEPPFEKVYL